MVAKTALSKQKLQDILSNYTLGEYKDARPFTAGTVQTNFLLETTKERFVFRYYENRSEGSVLFECNLLLYLKSKSYPCPEPIRNKYGRYVELYNRKPYVIFEFMEGQHIEHPDEEQKKQLIRKVAELQNITRNYKPRHKKHRWNYSVELCRILARREADKIDTANARRKLIWLEGELSKLELPRSLPKGICHCDFHFSNVLFKDGKFNALLDFDDANYTFLMFDLVGLLESMAWHHDKDDVLNFDVAKEVLSEYMRYRSLSNNEKRHLYDVYKLSILFDCVWYFGRGGAADFYEKRKVDYLNAIGREIFYNALFEITPSTSHLPKL
jgi:Ser/Thr protein kinase RdoA (MazF antagonist)